MKQMMKRMKRTLTSNSGIGTVEIILILVVLIALVLIFKDQIMSLAQSIFSHINRSVNGVY